MNASTEPIELVPVAEGAVAQARALEAKLLASDVEVRLAAPPKKACCGGSCGCAGKLQVLVSKDDVPKVAAIMQNEWLEAVRAEGLGGEAFVQLGTPGTEGELRCPACGFSGALINGACGDCGLQLE